MDISRKISRPSTLLCSNILISFLCCLPLVEFAPVVSDSQAITYLSKFGYLNPSLGDSSKDALIDGETLNTAISEFQSFAGLNVTGELNNETIETMSLPRCGVKDKEVNRSCSRSKRYVLQRSRWKVMNLTYKISKYPRNSALGKTEVDEEVKKAFEVWTIHTDLTFTLVKNGPVHIEVSFESGEHGDGDPFDGKGGTLAHAYYPVYGGDAHFDDDEDWTAKSYRGTNLFLTAAHEFGHSLGLKHSDVKNALMAPFYRGYNRSFELNQDDIDGIQRLYGIKTQLDISLNRSSNEPFKSENEKLCSDPKIDTIFNSVEGDTFVFKGDDYYKLTDDGVASGYPKPISSNWRELPGSIDAAFTYKNGKTYFFKGSKYWRFFGTQMDGDYPKKINEGFTGIPNNIDTALVWSDNRMIYFYKGDRFWRFDPLARPPVKCSYPKPISNWDGVPDNIDTAFQYTDSYTYFFKDGAYYRFNDTTFGVDSADPAYPRSTAYWWFGCKSAPSGTIVTIRRKLINYY